jgi:putative heme-binding domain-containing protein
MRSGLTALYVALFLVAPLCLADEVLPARMDHAPNKPYSPEEARRKMTVPPGFHVDLVASEPEIVNPIAMAFDERGRIWITQSIEYPRKSAGPGRDAIKIIEGVDDAGRATKVTTFVDDLNIPTGIAVGYGGVWVLNSPDLLFYREKDGKPVGKEVVITGFGRTDFHELPSSLTWGPDGWLYGLNGVFNQSHVVDKHGKRHDFTAAMWRIHPRTREFQVFAQGTSNPYGIIWDAEGSAIVEVCHWATDHLFHFVETGYYLQQAGIYPPFTIKLGSITDHGHQKTAYCGIARLSTDQFPPQYRERVCVGNLHGDCINVDRLLRDGSTYLSKAEPDLLTSHDDWFMPVSLKIGPDGCLFVLDWYDRYHCSQDAVRDPAGVDRLKGRLYRVRYGESPQQPSFDLNADSNAGLTQRLGSPNIFFRESAQRILTQRLSNPASGHAEGRGSLEGICFDASKSRESRLQALYALIGSAPLGPSFHQKLLRHSDSAFRAWAVRAAGNSGNVSPAIADSVTRLSADPSPDVQLQVAIAATKIKDLDALPTLLQILRNCGNDKLIPVIVWANLHPLLENDSARFMTLLTSEKAPPSPGISALLSNIADRILSAHRPDVESTATLLDYAFRSGAPTTAQCVAAVAAKVEGLAPGVRDELSNRLRPLIEKTIGQKQSTPVILSVQLLAARLHVGTFDAADVRRKFVSSDGDESTRLQALDALIAFKDQPLLDALPGVISSASPELATRIFAALGRVENPRLADLLLAQYPKLDPRLQPLAIDLIMQREPWAAKLLGAVLANKLPKSVLNANDLRKIMDSDDREAIWAVEKAYGRIREERNPGREKVVAGMGDYLRKNMGNPFAGQHVFENLCGQCHTIYGKGAKIGPDITANGRSNFDQLLSNVFDPSLVIGPGYQVVTVVTRDGRNLTGLLAEDNDQRVVIRIPGGSEEVVPRSEVKYTRPSKLSMMPEGIENLLSRRDLSDLFAFLCLDKPPQDPGARPISGAPAVATTPSVHSDARIKLERSDRVLLVKSRLPGKEDWIDLAAYVTDPAMRPFLHPVRDPGGRVVLTEDKPADHPWQHGIFTGFHQVNGVNYWKEDQGRQHFVRLLDVSASADRVSWRALVNLVDSKGVAVLEEEDTITIHAPESADACMIDFNLLLRAGDHDVRFGKYFVGGLSVRMPWDATNPRQAHLNSEGITGRACEQKRAAWCTVERPFGDDIFGVAIFDHPSNAGYPSAWRADEQGLINPNVSGLGDWVLKAHGEKAFRYQLLVYHGPARRDALATRSESWNRQ